MSSIPSTGNLQSVIAGLSEVLFSTCYLTSLQDNCNVEYFYTRKLLVTLQPLSRILQLDTKKYDSFFTSGSD